MHMCGEVVDDRQRLREHPTEADEAVDHALSLQEFHAYPVVLEQQGL